MSEYAYFDLPNGGQLFFEINPEYQQDSTDSERDMGLLSGQNKVIQAKKTLIEAMEAFVPAANIILNQLKVLSPDELTVKMGVSLSTEVGFALTKTSGEGHLRIVLKWHNEVASE